MAATSSCGRAEELDMNLLGRIYIRLEWDWQCESLWKAKIYKWLTKSGLGRPPGLVYLEPIDADEYFAL